MKDLEPRGGTKVEEALASPSIKHILDLARREARSANFSFVDTGFLLWAIAKENQKAARVLSEMGVTCQAIMDNIEPFSLERPIKSEEVELTDLCQEAFDIAAGYKSNQVNSLHLLSALLSIEGGLAKGALTRLGVNLDQLRNRVDQLIIASRRRDSWKVEIDLPGLPKTKRAIQKLKSQETGNILEDFSEDLTFRDVKETLTEFLKSGPNDESLAKFRQELAAFLFEQYAFRLIQARLWEIGRLNGNCCNEVLSPQLTTMTVSAARPDLPTVVSYQGLKRSKHGIKNPDGILLRVSSDQTVICGVCEYSLSSGQVSDLSDYKQAQIERFSSGQIIDDILVDDSVQERLGQFLSNIRSRYHPKLVVDRESWKLIYVKPQRSLRHRQDYLVRDGLVVVNAPFAAKQWGRVVDGLLEDIRKTLVKEAVSAD